MAMSSRLIQRARQLRQAGNFVDARAILDAVLASEPDNEAAWQLRLEVSESLTDREAALRALLRLQPDDEGWRDQLAILNASRTPAQQKHHQYRRLYWGAAVLVLLVAAAATYFVSHNPLQADVDRLTDHIHSLTSSYNQLERQYLGLVANYDALQTDHLQLQRDLDQLKNQHVALRQQHVELTAQYQTLQQQHAKLAADYQTLQTDFANLRAYSDQLNASYTTFRNIAVAPPYIYIHGRQVTMAFVKLDGNIERWDVPFDRLENDLERGHQVRANDNAQLPVLSLTNTNTGEHYKVVDFRPLVEGRTFSQVIPALYLSSGSEEQFLQEAWNIVSQLTVYSEEIAETPRYPLETLLAGGGDCEDTSILLASLVKAAPVNWKVYLLYMDGDHPTAPQTVNHVVVYVDTGWHQYTIETTSHQNMLPYSSGVDGWYEQLP